MGSVCPLGPCPLGHKSVLVEGTGKALSTMAAYIDLNPVRAGIVKDPAQYRWSGYAEAVARCNLARLGLKKVVMGVLASERAGETGRQQMGRLLARCRVYLFEKGEQREALPTGFEAPGVKGSFWQSGF